MAIGAGAAAAIGAAATIASAGGQMYANAKLNKRAERYNRDMAAIQRGWALEDWNMMNEYNSPAAQMQRYKDAGLNPNLIYGQTNEGATVRSTDIGGVNYKGTDVATPIAAAGESFSKYYSLKMQDQGVKNMEMEYQLKEMDMQVKRAQIGNIVANTMSTLTGTASTQFDLDYKNELRQTNMDIVRQSLERGGVEIGIMKNRDFREAMSNVQNIKESEQRIKVMKGTLLGIADSHLLAPLQREKVKQEIEQLKKSGRMAELDIDLKKFDQSMRELNIPANSPYWLKALGAVLSNYIPSIIGTPIKSPGNEELQKGIDDLGIFK